MVVFKVVLYLVLCCARVGLLVCILFGGYYMVLCLGLAWWFDVCYLLFCLGFDYIVWIVLVWLMNDASVWLVLCVG